MRGCQERNRSPATRRLGGGSGSRGACVWGPGPGAAAAAAGTSAVPGSPAPALFLGPSCPACPPRLRPPRLGEDAATHVALEVGPRTLRRLSGCPLAAPTPWGSPLRPPGVPPSAASAPAPPPRPCVRSRLSLAHLQPPTLCPPWHPPKSVSVCLSGSPLKPVAGMCVCVRGRRETACLGDCLPLPAWPPPTSRHPPTPPLSNTGRHTHIHTRIHAPPHFPGIPLNTPGA